MKKRVLLYGPQMEFKNAKYGGGTGGYTRNMGTYLSSFKSENFELIPSYHSVKSSSNDNVIGKVYRLFRDTSYFLKDILLHKRPLVHILAQYRGAISREYAVCLICRLFNINYIYEIKAGVFDDWYINTNKLNQYFVKNILKHSSLLLVEGFRYKGFIKKEFNLESVYWPNFVDSKEIPEDHSISMPSIYKESAEAFIVSFTGYCYEGKGVFELVDALNLLAKSKSIKIHLDLIGKESASFTNYLNSFNYNKFFTIKRHGKVSHPKVLEIVSHSHLFCLPSKHKGEGHNNSINEAFMMNVPVMTTKHGFSEDILKNQRGWLLDELSVHTLSNAISNFIDNPLDIYIRTQMAQDFFKKNLHSEVVIPRLDKLYLSIEGNKCETNPPKYS